MRTTNVVSREKLKEVYADGIHGFENIHSGTTKGKLDVIPLLDEFFEVQVISRAGPYSVVEALNTAQGDRMMIVPTDLIQTKQVKSIEEVIKTVCDKMFPGNYHFSETHYSLALRYPELEIKNSLNQTHTIRDLVVLLLFDEQGRLLHDIKGTRLTLTPEEYYVGYLHSHLNHLGFTRGASLQFRSFCQGNSKFYKFVIQQNKIIQENDLELFLLQLEQYLCWESLEGKPFIGIRQIGTTETRNFGPDDTISVSDSLLLWEIYSYKALRNLPKELIQFSKEGVYISLLSKKNQEIYYEAVEKPILLEVEHFKRQRVLWDRKQGVFVSQHTDIDSSDLLPPSKDTLVSQTLPDSWKFKFYEESKDTPTPDEDIIERFKPGFSHALFNTLTIQLNRVYYSYGRRKHTTGREGDNDQGAGSPSGVPAPTSS